MLILESLAANAVLVVVALVLGEAVLRAAERVAGAESSGPSLIRVGAALLAGFGACAYVGIVLAAVHLFRWQAFVVTAVVIVATGRRTVSAYARSVRLPRRDVVVLLASAAAVVVAAAQWLAALAPPEASDELAYHLPEAHTLADGHVLHLALGTDRIYGNLPTLVETLYGEALTIRGTALAHLVHLSILLAFVLLAAGVVRALWGARAAALATLGILLYSDLLYDATTAYVDAAEASFEAGAALLFVLWTVRGDLAQAAAAALLLGLALSVKYNALAAAGMAAVLVVVVRPRVAVRLGAIAFVACGYWYVKNLVRFGNPVYPFYLGHPGVSDATYRYFIRNIHAFGPRTVGAFVEVPTRFASDANATAFLGFALAPLAPFARGPRRAAVLLIAYVLAYATYWFWFATHQTRFLYAAVVIAIVLAAAAVGAARGRRYLAVAVALALVLAAGAQHKTSGFNLHLRAAVDGWLDTPKVRYTVGLESRQSYLHRYFGCQVDAVDELAARHLRGAVALWDLSPNPEYPRANRLEPIKVTAATPAGVRAQLRARDIRFAFAQGMPVGELSSNPAARPVLAAARPFWRRGDCTLYRLRLSGP
ncbi:MAG TPA: hypothetical protein VKP14_06720 [Gaiellaceae bacterium]|nr:hypothetical protein [Gaiellaceae bacterium]